MNVAASIRQRLYNLARASNDDFQRLLTQYALERLLYRLSVSAYREQFVLKGAMLFLLWMEQPHRRTRDLDLLGSGSPSPNRLVTLFQELCQWEGEDDGLRFDPETVRAKAIREDNVYGGIRVTLLAFLERARIPVQVDIGFGDAITPEPVEIVFPTLLPTSAAPHLRAYVQETVIAEKLSAMVDLDLDNSRMKDFFDLWFLSRQFSFDGATLQEAIRATFARRGQTLPTIPPTALTSAFSEHPGKQLQWQAFVAQNVTDPYRALMLPDVVSALADFLVPVLYAWQQDEDFQQEWLPGDRWHSQTSESGENS